MLIFSHENPLIVANIKNILENKRIEVVLKNEFTRGATGEVSVFESWQEVWLVNPDDQPEAELLIKEAMHQSKAPDWFCPNCKEANGASFEICWNCQQASP